MKSIFVAPIIISIALNLANLSLCARNDAGIELKVIPNTNLLTGVTYQITLPKEPFAVVTWADLRTDDGGSFTQIDNHEERMSRYQPGGDWYNDGLWVFEPSDDPNYIRIKNVGPHSTSNGYLVTKLDTDTPERGVANWDNYIYIASRSRYSSGDYSLWKVIPSGAHDQFTLHNKGLPGYAIGVKYPGGRHRPYDENGNGFYTYWKIESDRAEWPKYRRGGEKRGEVLLKIKAMYV